MATVIDQMAVVLALTAIGSFVIGGGVSFTLGRWSKSQQAVFLELREKLQESERAGRDKDSQIAQLQMAVTDLKEVRRSMKAYAVHAALQARQTADNFDALADQRGAGERQHGRSA